MEKPIINFSTFSPLLVQTYERYLPTAFDESMSLLEKVNKVILYLNEIGKLSNDVLEQWNTVMTWVMSDGLDASIDSKLDSMVVDGTLATIINKDIFNDLNTSITNLTGVVSQNKTDVETEIATTKTDLQTEISTSQTTLETEINDTKILLQDEIKTKGNKYYGTPEDYGAVGDGLTDDWKAIQDCLNENKITLFQPTTYLISKTLVLPENHSIDGNHAELLASGGWIASNVGNSVPQNTMLFVKGRQPIWLSELDMETKFVRNLRIRGVTGKSLTGMYLGTEDNTLITQASCVNYAVYGCNFENIFISYVDNGLSLGESWACQFTRIATNHISQSALYICGQNVNNTFVGCMFGTSKEGQYGVYCDAFTYNGELRRSEGCSFIGGFIGNANIGINIKSALAFKFSEVIIDLNTTYSVTGSDMSDITFNGCYLYSEASVFSIAPIGTTVNGTFVTFSHCNFYPSGGGHAVYVNTNQNGIIVSECYIRNDIYFSPGASGNVNNNVWGGTPQSVTPVITDDGVGVVTASNNTWKYDGSPVPTSGTV